MRKIASVLCYAGGSGHRHMQEEIRKEEVSKEERRVVHEYKECTLSCLFI